MSSPVLITLRHRSGAAGAAEVEWQPGRVVGEGEGAEAAVVLAAAGAKICRGTRGSACCDSDTTQSQDEKESK